MIDSIRSGKVLWGGLLLEESTLIALSYSRCVDSCLERLEEAWHLLDLLLAAPALCHSCAACWILTHLSLGCWDRGVLVYSPHKLH